MICLLRGELVELRVRHRNPRRLMMRAPLVHRVQELAAWGFQLGVICGRESSGVGSAFRRALLSGRWLQPLQLDCLNSSVPGCGRLIAWLPRRFWEQEEDQVQRARLLAIRSEVGGCWLFAVKSAGSG